MRRYSLTHWAKFSRRFTNEQPQTASQNLIFLHRTLPWSVASTSTDVVNCSAKLRLFSTLKNLAGNLNWQRNMENWFSAYSSLFLLAFFSFFLSEEKKPSAFHFHIASEWDSCYKKKTYFQFRLCWFREVLSGNFGAVMLAIINLVVSQKIKFIFFSKSVVYHKKSW